ncbi:hypothetical protein FJ930_13120 [Mesorhizobium sp. B2-4-15]|uniref:hypothetical protein n=1 Tax=Mesorhizobium sp. B2-4-15 TaxID=2589934 RepID=UPI00114DC8CB|nr:hypothetical protein [Mesorhizobium sp. B2-4-15]TPK72102.1 hypothetical protein FJ930_13120 [Mesorhizobium sp. B2-4-15]
MAKGAHSASAISSDANGNYRRRFKLLSKSEPNGNSVNMTETMFWFAQTLPPTMATGEVRWQQDAPVGARRPLMQEGACATCKERAAAAFEGTALPGMTVASRL